MKDSRTPTHTELAALVAILLAAALLRLHALHSVPPGFSHDEANHTHDAAGVLAGIRPIYFTIGYGREPLYDYATSAVMLAVGRTGYASRLTSAFFGLLSVPLTWAAARRLAGPKTALSAAALLAVDFWPVMASRQALRSITLPALLLAAIYWWWRSIEAPRRANRKALAAGLLLGATFYTYLAARITWAVFPAMLAYFALFRRDRFRRAWRPTLIVLLLAAAASAPLFGWLLANPGAETRIGDLSYPIDQVRAGNFEPVLKNAISALGMFTWEGDRLWMYNLPSRPMVAPAIGILFVIGLGMAAIQALRGRLAPAFLLIWLVVGMVPNFITGVDAAATRAVGLMPAPYILAGWAMVTIAGRLAKTRPEVSKRRATALLAIPAALFVFITSLTTYREYFDIWADAPDVRVAYHTALVQTAAYLDASDNAHPVMMSSIRPEAPHDPSTVRATLRRDDLAIRWFDARGALLFPDEAQVWVTLPENTPLHPALALYFTGVEPVHRIELPPGDYNRSVDIYTWQPGRAFSAAITLLNTGANPTDPAPGIPILELLGYTRKVDGLVTFWRVLRRYGEKETDGIKLFAHVLDKDGNVIDQDDRLDAPSWAWQPGDVFAQVFDVDTSSAHTIYVGAYDRDTIDRLPIAVGDQTAQRAQIAIP